jgi:hypothetical protein
LSRSLRSQGRSAASGTGKARVAPRRSCVCVLARRRFPRGQGHLPLTAAIVGQRNGGPTSKCMVARRGFLVRHADGRVGNLALIQMSRDWKLPRFEARWGAADDVVLPKRDEGNPAVDPRFEPSAGSCRRQRARRADGGRGEPMDQKRGRHRRIQCRGWRPRHVSRPGRVGCLRFRVADVRVVQGPWTSSGTSVGGRVGAS